MLLNVVSFSLMYATIRDPDRLLSRDPLEERATSEHPLLTLIPCTQELDDDFT